MRILVVASAVVLVGCVNKPSPTAVKFGTSEGLAACDPDTIAAHPDERCFTWRAVAGVSMGGGTASRIGFSHPELWDVVADMGGPVTDVDFFLGMIENNHLTGFCSREKLEALVASGVDLNDATNPDVWCGTHDVFPLVNGQQVTPGYMVSAPDSQCAMFRSDYNHWYQGPDAGRGGSFSRNTFLESIADLTAIYGNMLYRNTENNYLPPGVPDSYLVDPQSSDVGDRCSHPAVVKNFINKEYNPDGKYDAITFCDGTSTKTADYDPTDAAGITSHVADFALALDINGNGKRDYGEPILNNGHERFSDVGVDGLADKDEPGYDPVTNPDPNHDDWDPFTNPEGTEGNLKYDEGEPFEDNGLDGVPNTHDYGEGDGVFTQAPNIVRTLERSPRHQLETMSDAMVARLDIWFDAGIRDFLNTSQNENALWTAIEKRIPDSHSYTDFKNLPGITGAYEYLNADYSRNAMGRATYLRYGDPSICPSSDAIQGTGNHVGPQVVDRLFTLFSFLSARMPAQGRNTSIGGTISGLGGPTGTLSDFAFMDSYDSKVLGHSQPYGVMLPPDYFVAPTEHYPVVYFFHGQGMSAQNMSQTGLALWGPMKDSARTDRIAAGKTDLQRAIIVWVDGQCQPGDCWTGNFYADFEGTPRADRNFEQAFYELASIVEHKYRAKAPELIPLDHVDDQ
jgi:hypothetical protein